MASNYLEKIRALIKFTLLSNILIDLGKNIIGL
jgi:hypothetical protein